MERPNSQGRVAVSSVPGSAARLLEDAAAGLASRLQAFCDERRYVGLVIVGVDIDRDQSQFFSFFLISIWNNITAVV